MPLGWFFAHPTCSLGVDHAYRDRQDAAVESWHSVSSIGNVNGDGQAA